MTKRTQLIGRSPRMEQVINLVSRPEFMRILESAYEPERNTFTDRRGGYGGGGGNSEYNGYFKIIDASITDDNGKTVNKIRIVDGATYDAGAGVSGISICKVNNKVFYIEMFSADVSVGKTYCLKYTAATEASGETPAAAAKVEIVELDAMPSDDAQTAYYQIGRTIIKDGTMKIAQDHTAGVAQIYWYLLCSEDEAKE